MQANLFDRQLGTLHQGFGGNDVEAKPERVRLDARGDPDLDDDPGDRMHAFLSSAFDDEIDDALAQRQLVHRRRSVGQPNGRKASGLVT